MRRALAQSLNVATVKIAEMVGYDRVANLWNKKMGMGATAQVQPYPALALGSFEATPLEIATAYNVLANGGLKVEPVTVLSVTDDKDRPLEEHKPQTPRVARPESAYLVTAMMRSVLNGGTAGGAWAMGLPQGIDVAGKTGTTNDMRDAWFAGFTPDLLCVVWVGFDDNSPVNLSGARAALPIWVDFMKGVARRHQALALPGAAREHHLPRHRPHDRPAGDALVPARRCRRRSSRAPSRRSTARATTPGTAIRSLDRGDGRGIDSFPVCGRLTQR